MLIEFVERAEHDGVEFDCIINTRTHHAEVRLGLDDSEILTIWRMLEKESREESRNSNQSRQS